MLLAEWKFKLVNDWAKKLFLIFRICWLSLWTQKWKKQMLKITTKMSRAIHQKTTIVCVNLDLRVNCKTLSMGLICLTLLLSLLTKSLSSVYKLKLSGTSIVKTQTVSQSSDYTLLLLKEIKAPKKQNSQLTDSFDNFSILNSMQSRLVLVHG